MSGDEKMEACVNRSTHTHSLFTDFEPLFRDTDGNKSKAHHFAKLFCPYSLQILKISTCNNVSEKKTTTFTTVCAETPEVTDLSMTSDGESFTYTPRHRKTNMKQH
jgi:hypothetical protein